MRVQIHEDKNVGIPISIKWGWRSQYKLSSTNTNCNIHSKLDFKSDRTKTAFLLLQKCAFISGQEDRSFLLTAELILIKSKQDHNGGKCFNSFCPNQVNLALGSVFSTVVLLLPTVSSLQLVWSVAGCWVLQLYFDVSWLQGKELWLLQAVAPALWVHKYNFSQTR